MMGHYDKFEEKKKQEYDALREQRGFFDAAMKVQEGESWGLTVLGEHELKEPEFDDQYLVLEMGAKKHGPKNWLEPNGSKSSHKDMHASMFRHLAESSTGKTKDDESGLHPLLHLATRALMVYTRQQRGIIHEDDVVDTKYTLDDVLGALDETISGIGNTESSQESIDMLWKGLEGVTIMLEEMKDATR